ncbi:MAG TPA: sulfotransferase [Acidimicrobiia bacterium]|jgi:hypothetical protein
MARGSVSTLVVGSPRSGTTLVQRLASELPGVAIPFETHFFTKGLPLILARRTFPIGREELVRGLASYCALPALEGSGLSADAILEQLDLPARSALQVFDAVVAAACGHARGYAEKTPAHLFWAARLLGMRKGLRVVGVVRDPRAVVLSRLEVPWGRSRVDVQAYRWLEAQQEMARLTKAFPDRVRVWHYEDVVAEPDATRADLASFMRVDASAGAATSEQGKSTLGLEWETWKTAADAPITRDREERWRDVLDSDQLELIGAICAPMLARYGYEDAMTSDRALTGRSGAARETKRRLRALEEETARRREEIATTDLGEADPSAPQLT